MLKMDEVLGRKKKTTSLISDAKAQAAKLVDESMKAAKAHKKANDDAEFYFVAAFQSKEQKKAFLKALKLQEDWSLYVDGRKLAKACGVEIPSAHKPSTTGEEEKFMDGDI